MEKVYFGFPFQRDPVYRGGKTQQQAGREGVVVGAAD